MMLTEFIHVCSARESVMSERAATAGVTGTSGETGRPAAEPQTAEPALATADLLVEEVSIDGMCGVY
jgi:mycofactocin precursor